MNSFGEINKKNTNIIIAIYITLFIIILLLLIYIILYNPNKLGNNIIFWLYLFLILFLGFIQFLLLYYLTKFETVITIKEKLSPMYGKGSIYRIVDTNNNIFELRDNILLLDFNSANDYVSLEEGHKYKIHGYGARINILSLYPKINSFQKI